MNELEGCIDMHVHFDPDPFRKRKGTAVELARQAAQAGMRGVVLKSHDYLTTPLCASLNGLKMGAELFGSLTLNRAAGGLNPQAVLVAARLGTRIIWLPTFDSIVDAARRGEGGIRVASEDGSLVDGMERIFEIVREYDIVLCTGHIAEAEVFAVVARAVKRGIRVVVTHPLTTIAGNPLALDKQKALAGMGAYIEHCYVACMPAVQGLDPMRIAEAVKAVGAERCVLDTDFGQDYNPPPAEGMLMMVRALKECGLSDREIELAIKINPAQLLKIS